MDYIKIIVIYYINTLFIHKHMYTILHIRHATYTLHLKRTYI